MRNDRMELLKFILSLRNKRLEPCYFKCWCVFCKEGIPRGEHYLRFERSGYKRKFRINVCIGCLRNISKEISRTELKHKKLRRTAENI